MDRTLNIEDLLKKLEIAEERAKIAEKKAEKAEKEIEIAEERAEKAEREAEIEIEKAEKKAKKIEKEIRKIKKEVKFTDELYEYGIPNLIFTKTVTDSTQYTSKHEEIRNEFINSKISIIDNIDDFINHDSLKNKPSTFLINCMEKKGFIDFDSELTIQKIVDMYFNDLIKCTNLNLITIGGTTSGIENSDELNNNINNNKFLKPDLWVVIDNDYRPVLVIEVKSPCDTNSRAKSKINDKKITGQLYNYMLKLKSFYGQRYVFGIVTTLDEWKIYWLPDTNDYAQENILNHLDIELYDNNEDNENREVYSSRVYKHNEKDLSKLIITIIAKSYYSPKQPVSLLNEKRTYIMLKKDSWRWIKYEKNDLTLLSNNMNLNISHGNATDFTVLRYFKGGVYSKIRLAISNKGNIVVLKEFLEDDSNLEQEKKCWKEINDVKTNIKILNKTKTIIMPLAFHAHIDNKKLNIYIPLDLKIWSVQEGAISDDLPEFLENINQDLSEYNLPSLREIAEEAIDKCANSGWIHRDLEFRHIAVLPIIENNRLIYLDPIFIDFGIMEKSSNKIEAKKIMMKKLNKLFYKYGNYSFN